MQISFIRTLLTAATILEGHLLSSQVQAHSQTSNCETALKPTYECTITLENGESANYCLMTSVDTPGDGCGHADRRTVIDHVVLL